MKRKDMVRSSSPAKEGDGSDKLTLPALFAGLRQGGRSDGSAITANVEKWLTSDEQLEEKTRIETLNDIHGIAFLKASGRDMGVPEFEAIGVDMEHLLVAKEGERAIMMSNTLMALVFNQLEVLKAQQKAAETQGRERSK